MARRKKNQLPSGKFRKRVYDYTDSRGVRRYQSFVAATRDEAEAKAREWKMHRRDILNGSVALSEALEAYINIKSNILSPSTISGYRTEEKRINEHRIARIKVRDITSTDIQIFVSDISLRVSPKTVTNTVGLLLAAVKMYHPTFIANVTMPKKTRPRTYTPTTDDVQKMINACQSTELKIAILFAAIGTMRRGEACAVTFKDVNYNNNTVSINKSFVYHDGYFELKTPKTYESYRTIRLPQYVIDLIKSIDKSDREYVIGLNPNQLYRKFEIILRDAGVPHCRYHDLRHHAASYMHLMGIPDKYIEAIGGWRAGSTVLKTVYENVIDMEVYKMSDKYQESIRFNVN